MNPALPCPRFSAFPAPMRHRILSLYSLLPAVFVLLAVPVFAHHLPPGMEEVDEFSDSASFLMGINHPLSGLDHLLAALLTGVGGGKVWQTRTVRAAGGGDGRNVCRRAPGAIARGRIHAPGINCRSGGDCLYPFGASTADRLGRAGAFSGLARQCSCHGGSADRVTRILPGRGRYGHDADDDHGTRARPFGAPLDADTTG